MSQTWGFLVPKVIGSILLSPFNPFVEELPLDSASASLFADVKDSGSPREAPNMLDRAKVSSAAPRTELDDARFGFDEVSYARAKIGWESTELMKGMQLLPLGKRRCLPPPSHNA